MKNIKYGKLKKSFVDHLYYELGMDTPYTGKATRFYNTGEVQMECKYKNGVLHGRSIWWFRDGHKEYETCYVQGKKLLSLCIEEYRK